MKHSSSNGKASRVLQTTDLDLSLISSLVDATLNSLDDAILPSVNLVLQLQDAGEELNAATGIEVTHLEYMLFSRKEWASLLSDSSKMTYPADLNPHKRCVISLQHFWSKENAQPSLLMSYLYMETVRFKLPLDSLWETYQLNHWKELNLRWQPLSLLTSAQSGKCIVISY